ncbi:hypothetical protein DFH07DRAFT_539487 [Mycena maculata]|uniref:F-box domain-containing protein n=1 Tax=Mycena maculata TaxID=230809 RepID=A0AAD7NWI5_9AGAR|nr:hypothetical protein DFH07DRAFT_539487 [Mycena maculata]
MEIQLDPQCTTTLCINCDHAFEHNRYRLDSALLALRHNYAPEGPEAHRISRTIDAIGSQFERYDPEISRVQNVLASLRDQRRRLQWFQECCHSLLSPIRKLPPEILQTIFFASKGPEPDVIPVEGQVCRHWRDVVVETPKLWSNISVGRNRFSYTQRYHDLASLFLERSTSRPLSISIRSPVDIRLVELLAQHTWRWHTLHFSFPSPTFYEPLKLHLLGLPKLENLRIADTFGIGDIESDPIALPNAPQLRDVVLKGPLERWSLPWSQLTRLQYDVPRIQDAIGILRLCRGLVECSLDKLSVAVEEDPSSLCTLRDLRFLRLAVETTGVTSTPEAHIMKTFFTSLKTPKLASLEVVGQFNPTDFTEFLLRSKCKLKHLTLGTGYTKDETIILALENLPALKTLVLDADIGTTRHIQNRVITDKLLRRLVLDPNSPDCLLPRLTHLALRTSVNFEDQVLFDLIDSRWILWVTELSGVRVSRLASVDLHFCGKKEELAPFTVAQLRVFFKAGLRISLQHGSRKISLE